jgi:uncharacterized protein YkwD
VRVVTDNCGMHRLLVLSCVALLTAVVGCGGGGNNHAQTAPPAPTPKAGAGGTVTVQPTIGRLGPAETVAPGRTRLIGKPGPMSPNASKPTQTQIHGVAGGPVCASASANPSGANLGLIQGVILCLLNQERQAHGLGPLRSNSRLGKASKQMAVLMVKERFFAHDTPDGRSLLDRVKPTGYVKGSWQLGENLAWGSGVLATPRSIVNSWMNSPGHRANILHGAFHDIGIGIRLGAPEQGLSGGATYVTDFGKHG